MALGPYELSYSSLVRREDIPRLDPSMRARIQEAVQQKLSYAPELFGAPLREALRGFRKLRVGDYRVIYRIENRIVRVLIIGNRSDVYVRAQKRI